MHNQRYLLLGIFILLSITSVSAAAQLTLLCLDKGQTVRFSACNALIQDRSCNSNLGCQFCATFNAETGIYCPASINACNLQQKLACSSLNNAGEIISPSEGNQAGQNTQNNSSPPVQIPQNVKRVKADVAYVVKDASGVDASLVEELTKNGYTHEVIIESQIAQTNFDDYYLLLIGNQKFTAPANIPVEKYKSLILNTFHYYKRVTDPQWGLSKNPSFVSSPTPLTVQDIIHPIVAGLPKNFQAYTVKDVRVASSVLGGEKPRGINIVVSAGLASNTVIATISPGITYLNGKLAKERSVFFGIPVARSWTPETKKLFKNSLQWLIEGADIDGDGYLSDTDCNDRNPDINTGKTDPKFDCKNDAPTLESFEEVTVYKGDKAIIPISATDPENDPLIYTINDPRFIFSQQEKSFSWQTTLNDGGRYTFTIEVTDGSFRTSQSVIVKVINNPPEWREILNLSWEEDTPFTFDIKKYASDKEGNALTFGVAQSSSNAHVQAGMTTPGVFTFTSSPHWFGEDWIIFSVSDGTETKLSNRVTLRITPVNDPVTFTKKIQDLQWNEDQSLLNAIDLTVHFLDVDSDVEYSASGNRNIQIAIDQRKASFLPAPDWNGIETVTFTARDKSGRVESNEVKLTVLPKDEPPVLTSLNCQKVMEEDKEYSCVVESSDVENDIPTFSSGNAENMVCTIEGNVLKYRSAPDYAGIARCTIIVTDKDGKDQEILEVSISPVNDAPRATLKNPESAFLKLGEFQEKRFTLDTQDAEDDDVSITWHLNNLPETTTGKNYLFKKGQGIYMLEARLSDGLAESSSFWGIIVEPLSSLTCVEAGGNICLENQICAGSLLGVKDSPACCSVLCVRGPPQFKDTDTCATLNDSLKIEIHHPSPSEKIKIGDTIKTELTFHNELDENQNLGIQVVLYDLTKDKAVTENEASVKVEEKSRQTLRTDLLIPDDLELTREYVLFVKAEDEICNQKYSDLEIERPEYKLVLAEFEVPSKAQCGEELKIPVKIKNRGREDQNISLELKNRELKISQEISNISIEKFGEKESVTKEFLVHIPQDAEEKEYTLNLMVQGKEVISQSRALSLSGCAEKSEENLQEPDEVRQILELNNPSLDTITEQSQEERMNNTLILAFMLLVTFVSIAFLFFCYLKGKKGTSIKGVSDSNSEVDALPHLPSSE